MEITGNQLFIINTLVEISKKYKKHYCFPSQKTLLNTLDKFYNIKRSLSTLNRWLRILEDKELIKRVRRLKRQSDNSIHFKSTIYFVMGKGVDALHRCGFKMWDQLLERWKKAKRLREKAGAARSAIGEELISYSEFKRRLASGASARAPV